jgi:hypothetical protein
MRRRALKGAIASRQGKGLAPGELGPLENHADAKRWLCLIGEAVVTGRLSNRDALEPRRTGRREGRRGMDEGDRRGLRREGRGRAT